MEFLYKKFDHKRFTLYPLGDFHLGSPQCNEGFIRQVLQEIKDNDDAYWCGMGDMMENAIVGSKSDVYTQTLPPKEQMEHIVDLLTPIKDKGLFAIAGNHEQRSMRVVGLIPEQFICYHLDIPYMGFSCLAVFQLMQSKNPQGFSCYFHHNYGGGYTPGGKVNRAAKPRQICPTVDAVFSAHFHTTSRIPVTWFEPARKQIIKHTGYDYITGSALEWNRSYAEEKCKPPAATEFIKVTFIGNTSGKLDNREQLYQVITPNGR
jgi:hypothetical protein